MAGDECETVDQWLERQEWEAAVRRDDLMTAAERAVANQVMAEHYGAVWRPEWVVRT